MNLFKIKKSLIIILAFIFIFNSYGDISRKQKVVTHIVLKTLKQYHYNPLILDDDFSKKVFNQYIEKLDYGKRFFTKQDLKSLRSFETNIDDELRMVSDNFYSSSTKLFLKKVTYVDSIYKIILQNPFNYTEIDSFETDYDKMEICQNNQALLKRWNKILKYQTIQKYLEIIDSKNKVKNKDLEKKVKVEYLFGKKLNKEAEKQAREKILKRIKKFIKTIYDRTDEQRYSDYLNAITSVYDPHTSYFPPKDKQDFDIGMTGKFEGIGASLMQEDGYTKVSSIVPGSASSRQGKLKADDVILKVGQDEDEAVDIVDMPLREVVKLIRGKKGTVVSLTVRKPDMTIEVINIVRDEVVLEETYAKAATINLDNTNVGYIQLLKFYRDFNNKSARNATDDIRMAVQHMPKIDGLILDLRYNGGGALPDAIDIAGLFIEKGPIVQVKERNGRKKVHNDNDPEIYYNGPLIVLVNQYSASASEILAAALQDYGRAVIVGSNQTFGKGTVQIMLDLNRAAKFYSMDGGLGALKITYQKFYRANGGCTQRKGVRSDVVIPNLYSDLGRSEKDQHFALPWDKIESSDYQEWPQRANTKNIIESSEKRVAQNEQFSLIKKYSEELKYERQHSKISLNINSIITERKKNKQESKTLDKLEKEMKKAKVELVEYNGSSNMKDKDKKTKEWYKSIKHDSNIQESINIIKDLKK